MEILHNKELKHFSTFHIGGPARFLTTVTSLDELEQALDFARTEHIPVLCVGKGSNMLFHDAGFSGLALINRLSSFHEKGDGCFEVGAGGSFAQFGRRTAKENWSGLEFAAGIPASVGGAVYMNAGAAGQDVQQTLRSVSTITLDGKKKSYAAEDLSLSYRFSSLQETQEIIYSASFQLTRSSTAYALLQEKLSHRMKTQPYSDKSAGCFFRNPPGESAGRLIERAGLKGCSCGGAAVSLVHANFIINRGEATADHVRQLASEIVERVERMFGIRLVTEVRILDQDGTRI